MIILLSGMIALSNLYDNNIVKRYDSIINFYYSIIKKCNSIKWYDSIIK